MSLASIASILFEPIAKEVFKLVSKIASSNNKILRVNQKSIEEAITQHITKVNTFTSEISFRELNKPKSLFSIYIPLDLSLRPQEDLYFSPKEINRNNSTEDKSASKVIEDVFLNSRNNVILIGAPGSGKTTTLKFICQKLFTDEKFLGNTIKFPLLIRLREDEILNNEAIPLFEYILNVFGIIIENKIKCTDPIDDKKQIDLFKKQTAIKIINKLSPLLVLDGIDEVSEEIVKAKLIKNINELSLSTDSARFVLTTRKGDDSFHIENTQVFELSPLNDQQIKEFTNKWLGDEKSINFLSQLNNSSIYDAAKRPLTLSHLCAIYEKEGRIPEKSRSIYRKIVNLLILDWNVENQINRLSKFSGFDPDRKKEFLENLAFELSVHFNKNQFRTNDLEKCYRNLYIKFNLPYTQMPEVINEIQVHNGLITQTGYDRFEFAHKSFQEYLVAEHIVKLPKLPITIDLFKIPSEMALTVNLSSESTEYLSYFINDYLLKNNCDFSFIKSFFIRIGIEKPDFLESRTIGLQLLKLQNQYCIYIIAALSDKQNNSNLNIFHEYFNNINIAFSSLASFDNIKNSISPFGQYYKAYPEAFPNANFYKLSYIRRDIENELPEIIYVTQGFFSEFLSHTAELAY